MARVISAEKLEEKKATVEVGELGVPELENLIEKLNGIDLEQWETFSNDLKDHYPGISRSVMANFKAFKEIHGAMNALVNKFRAEVEEEKESYEKSVKNKDGGGSSGGSGSSAKTGWSMEQIGYTEQIGMSTKLGKTIQTWCSGFGSNGVAVVVPMSCVGYLRKEIQDEFPAGKKWDGKSLRIRKDKREFDCYVDSHGQIVFRKM